MNEIVENFEISLIEDGKSSKRIESIKAFINNLNNALKQDYQSIEIEWLITFFIVINIHY